MASFQQAHALTAQIEGGYANNSLDRGGMTYAGVARNFWPKWPGWLIIDQLRTASGFPRNLAASSVLQAAVLAFYKENFWDVLCLDKVASQAIANEVYDSAVNCGTGKAALWLQRAINVTNAGGTKAADVVADGQVGPATLAALNAHKAPLLVLKALNILQGAHCIAIAEGNKSQEVFINSWFSRVSLT